MVYRYKVKAKVEGDIIDIDDEVRKKIGDKILYVEIFPPDTVYVYLTEPVEGLEA
jgi:hypothetical protein